MRGIGGNIRATIQVKTVTKNVLHEHEEVWLDVQTIKGWLDLASGNSGYQTYNAKIQESTHIFISDYVKLDERITSENARMLVNGKRYDIMLIDNPMELNAQLEFYLRFTGGQ